MQCYSELIPPSGITHAQALPFLSASADNLVIARSSLLQIFSQKRIESSSDTKLVLTTECQLSGTVTSLGRVKLSTTKSGGEALLIAFKDAKLSLVEWDPSQHSISTISIHYYENHALQICPWLPALQDCATHLTIDPGSRCAAFHFQVSNLAIIPFQRSAEDLMMDELDDLEDNEPVATTNGTHPVDANEMPYKASFVLPLTALDPGLLYPVSMAFLHEYRQPTLGILYSSVTPSANLEHERKDVLIYAVHSLDLEERESTPLLSTQALPNDLFKVVALPAPLGGALLIGDNELIHIDQSGRTKALAVNEFAKIVSAFPMADESGHQLRLEGCEVEQLGTAPGEMLMILATGELAILAFRIDGRSVSGLSLRLNDRRSSSGIFRSRASAVASLSEDCLFIASESADAVLVSTTKASGNLKRQSSRMHLQSAANSDNNMDEMDEDEDDDDLYADVTANGRNGHTESSSSSGPAVRILDRLPVLAPLRDVALGKSSAREPRGGVDASSPDSRTTASLELAVACGEGRAGGLALFSKGIHPILSKKTKVEGASGVWSFSATTSGHSKGSFYDHLIISRFTEEQSSCELYELQNGEPVPLEGTEFDTTAGPTITVGRLIKTNHTAHVSPTEIRVYDSEFALSQIYPIVDEDAGTTARAVNACFADPFVALVKDDGRITVLQADKSGELEELDLPDHLQNDNILCATIFKDDNDFFQSSKYKSSSSSVAGHFILTVLSKDGQLTVNPLPNLDIQIFHYSGLNYLPLELAVENPIPKHWRNPDQLAEVLLANLGDETEQHPFLVVRNFNGDISIYKPCADPTVAGAFRFKKMKSKSMIPGSNASKDEDPTLLRTRQWMQVCPNMGGFATVVVPGQCPYAILRTASSMPQVYELGSANMRWMSLFNGPQCKNGFIYIGDDNYLQMASIPQDVIYGLPDWVCRKVDIGEDVSSVVYHTPTGSYAIASHQLEPFQLPQDDEWHPEWQKEKADLLPCSDCSSLKLINPTSHHVISQYRFDNSERVVCLKSINLEVSEETHERKDLLVVGTALVKGENITTRGNVYLFDVVDVVPQPGIPETDLKLKLITKEDVRGAVTAICAIGSQGFFLNAQGQKCMVRGLKEDRTLLPVAFLDMQYYVQVAKELPGTGICLLGDACSGLWLAGYAEEPYKMQVLARDLENPSVTVAEFLPDGKQLYIISCDDHGELRVLQYDPENPKTERGSKMLVRSTFSTGLYPSTMTLLPRTPIPFELPDDSQSDDMELEPSYAKHQILITTQEGAIALITPLSDHTYRRLSTLQNILTTNLSHTCGLNPRAYRQVETDGIGGRGMIDGNLIIKWLDQSVWHKSSTADKAGGTVWEVMNDLEAVGGSGLGYL